MTVSISNIPATWTDPGKVYTGIGMNVSSNGYSSSSKLLNLKIANTSVFSVNTDGSVNANTTYGAIGSYTINNGMLLSTFNAMFPNNTAVNGATFDGGNIGFTGTVWRLMGYYTYVVVRGDEYENETRVLFLTVRVS